MRLTADILTQAIGEIKLLIKLQSKKYLHRQFKEPYDECKEVGEVKDVYELILSGIKSAE
jgi:hypothetical protein